MASRTGVVVVTHQSGDVLPPLLSSLAEHEPDSPVVIIDDASPGGPPDAAGHELIVMSDNRGYAASCNRGIAAMESHDVDLVAFLNPDVRLAGASLSELEQHFAERPRVGIATGPLRAPDGTRLPSAWGPTSVRRALAFAAGLEPQRLRAAAGAIVRTPVATSDTSTYLDDLRVEGHVIGGTMVARTACLAELDGLDEDFFLYWEDADLCHRARRAGWEIRVMPCAPIVHAAAQSTPDALTDGQRWQWFVEGAHRFGRKHLPPGQARQLEVALELGARLGRLRRPDAAGAAS